MLLEGQFSYIVNQQVGLGVAFKKIDVKKVVLSSSV
jgi:hypothetical protein